MNRLDRLTGILIALQSGRKRSAELAARFEVSRRTILRDIDGLSQAGVPIVAVSGPAGGYEIAEGYFVRPLQFTAAEAATLLLALKALGGDERSPFAETGQSVAEKLRAVMPSALVDRAERHVDSVTIARASDDAARLDCLPLVQRALAESAWLRIRYRGATADRERLILPLRLVLDRGRWYCRAMAYDAGEQRTFRADRILAAEPTAAPLDAAVVVERADAAEALPPDVLLRCLVQIALPAIRRVQDHPDFTGKVDPSGLLAFDSPPSELGYFAGEVFALGPDALVLAPVALRELVCRKAQATLRRYAGSIGDGTVSPKGSYGGDNGASAPDREPSEATT